MYLELKMKFLLDQIVLFLEEQLIFSQELI